MLWALEEPMAEAAPNTGKQDQPTKTCLKCRMEFPLEAFSHTVEGQEGVCRRCLAVMGYQV